MGHSILSPEHFVVIWNDSRSLADFCSRTGHTFSSAHARAKTFRKKGVKLKYLGTHLRDVERLEEVKKLAEETFEVWDVETLLKGDERKAKC